MRPALKSRARQGQGKSSVPAWLPVPAVGQAPKRLARPGMKAAKVCRGIWISTEWEHLSEKLMLTMFGLAAVLGISYGFADLLDWVQNWAVIHAWAGQLAKW